MDPIVQQKLDEVKAFLTHQYEAEKAALRSEFKSVIIFWTVAVGASGVAIGYMLCKMTSH